MISDSIRERLWLAVLIPAVAVVLVLLHRAEPLAWDEIEFYRATRWIAEGKLPFRDYWEHHMPLQWFLFAPVAGIFGGGPGIDSVVALRWAQALLWIAVFMQAMKIAREEGVSVWGRRAALAMLLAAPTFIRVAVQYRVDVVGNLAFLAGFALIALRGTTRFRYIAFGMLMSAAVLANMRMAPLAIVAGLVALFWRSDERRWRWNATALWMAAGVVAVAGAFVAFLLLSGSWKAFLRDVVRFNPAFDALVPDEARTFAVRMFEPVTAVDITAILFIAAALTGVILTARRPGPLQLASILAAVAVLTIAATAVQYAYHFQIVYLLLVPAAAVAFDRIASRWRIAVPAVVLVALIITASRLSFTRIHYQDLIMREVEAHTRPDETVFDGVGYALRRPPAYRYWFLPSAARIMSKAGKIEPYDVSNLALAPPAAIIYTLRLHYWFLEYPHLGLWVFHHYVPLYRNLWIPGLSARVRPDENTTMWIVPKSGKYDIHASTLLARHPWITRPADYGFMEGPELEIPLDRLPPVPSDTLHWKVDGVPVTGKTLTLKRDSRVDLVYTGSEPAGVLVVPSGTKTLCSAPEGTFVF